MSDKKLNHPLRTGALCLAMAGAFALPGATASTSAQAAQAAQAIQAAPVAPVLSFSQDSAVVVKDAETGKLRAATPQENNALKATGNAKMQTMRVAPKPTLKKYHSSGATGARLTEEFMSSATVVRAADGTLVHECTDGAGHAAHAPHAATPAPTSVTE